MLLSIVVVAQEKPVISSAVIEYNKFLNTREADNIAQARTYIEEANDIIKGKAASEVNPKQLGKFYFYYGDIYMLIANSSNEKIKALDEDAVDKALWGFENLLEFEEKTGKASYTKKANEKYRFLPGNYINRGIKRADSENFQGAFDDFMKAYDLSGKISNGESLDTSMYYNAAFMAQKMENFEKALEMNKNLIKMGYKGITYEARNAETGEKVAFKTPEQMQKQLDAGKVLEPKIGEPLTPVLYVTAISLAQKLEKEEDRKALVTEARKKFPVNKDFLMFELQDFLNAKDYDGALKNFEIALESDPDNDLFLFNVGIITLQELKNPEKAEEYFKRAIAANPDNADAQYMLGVLVVNEANTYTEKINKLGLNETKKYDKLKTEQKAIFQKALGYFEKAYELNSDDSNVIIALQKVYYNIGNYEKSMEMQELIDAME